MGSAAYGAIGLGAMGAGYYYYTSQASPTLKMEGPAPKAFQGGDQGFLSLKLDSVEKISENTKKFRFALPEADQESGLPVACTSEDDYSFARDKMSKLTSMNSCRRNKVQGT